MTDGPGCARMAQGVLIMRLLILSLVAVIAVTAGFDPAQARVAMTTTDLTLRAAPSPKAAIVLTVPAGAKVQIGGCSQGWCKVSWQSQAGY